MTLIPHSKYCVGKLIKFNNIYKSNKYNYQEYIKCLINVTVIIFISLLLPLDTYLRMERNFTPYSLPSTFDLHFCQTLKDCTNTMTSSSIAVISSSIERGCCDIMVTSGSGRYIFIITCFLSDSSGTFPFLHMI